MENKLPKGWVELTLKEVVDYKKGKKPKNLQPSEFQDSVPYLDIKTIEKGVVGQHADKATSNITNENEILVVWDGARSGWVGKAIYGAIGSTLMAIKPKEINTEYLFRYLQTQFEYVNSNPRGTGIPHVDPEIFWNIKVPIPPIEEQSRIVAKLDTLLKKIITSKSRLGKIPVLLKYFRQSVLAAAVNGELTKEWRVNNRISDDWKEIKLKDAITSLDQGWSPKCENFSSLTPETWAVMKTTAVQHMDFLEVENKQLPSALSPEKRFEIQVDDVLITRAGPRIRVGVCCHVKKVRRNLMLCDKVYRLRMNDKVTIPGYIEVLLNTWERIKEIEEMKTGISDSGVNLTQTKVKDITFLNPSINEQKEIVRKVEELFQYADSLEARYQKAKAWFDKIPQAILAKAFRGELVPQDENDEPASVLLDRIKTEKTLSIKSKETHKRVKEIQ